MGRKLAAVSRFFSRVRVSSPGFGDGDLLRLDAVLEAVELPAGVAGLDAGLANVDGDDFTRRPGSYTVPVEA